MKYLIGILALAATTIGNTYAAGASLRISCEGADVGAEVLINGKFRGECPVDLKVPAGTVKLLVRKKIDGGKEQVFEQDIRLGDDSAKKIEVVLGAAKLNAADAEKRKENVRRLRAMPIEALEKEAAAGNLEAMVVLGKRLWNGPEATVKTEQVAGMWFRKAAEAGNVEAMYLYSVFVMSRHDGTPDEPIQLKIWAVKAAQGGSADAALHLGNRYRKGAALPQSDTQALQWYRRAAELGSAEGMMWVGMFYDHGRAVPKSTPEAIGWWRKAADAGDATAMYALGNTYEYGDGGVEINEEQAVSWYRKAADLGLLDAMKKLKERGLF